MTIRRSTGRRAHVRSAFGVALALLMAAFVSSPVPAEAGAGEALMDACAPPGGGAPLPICYAYIQAIIDDANLVGADVDGRLVARFGLFCAPAAVRIEDATAAVVQKIRADPSLRSHNAAIAVRLALPAIYPCSPAMLGRGSPAP